MIHSCAAERLAGRARQSASQHSARDWETVLAFGSRWLGRRPQRILPGPPVQVCRYHGSLPACTTSQAPGAAHAGLALTK